MHARVEYAHRTEHKGANQMRHVTEVESKSSEGVVNTLNVSETMKSKTTHCVRQNY